MRKNDIYSPEVINNLGEYLQNLNFELIALVYIKVKGFKS